MSQYTILTVFENTDTINEPVISFPMFGKMSFRQIGILIGIGIMLPMAIYSTCSDLILNALPDPVLSDHTARIQVTWDIVLALVPAPLGVILGVPRPKLIPMDILIVTLIRFMMYHTSVRLSTPAQVRHKSKSASKLAGFAKKERITASKNTRQVYPVIVTDLGIPKNITITLYDLEGNPMRNKFAKAYIDDELISSITADFDGVIGITFVPKTEGSKNLTIVIDGIDRPVVDAILDVKRQ